jgi:hypothetical protein
MRNMRDKRGNERSALKNPAYGDVIWRIDIY